MTTTDPTPKLSVIAKFKAVLNDEHAFLAIWCCALAALAIFVADPIKSGIGMTALFVVACLYLVARWRR